MEEDKNLDDFIRKSIKEVGLEKPSVDFTDSVLSKIATANQKKSVLVTKPLLSRTTWFLTLAALAAIFGHVIFSNSTTESTWLAAVKLNKLTSFNLSLHIPELSSSTAFIYGSIAIVLFVWIQVFLVKQRLDKRYAAG